MISYAVLVKEDGNSNVAFGRDSVIIVLQEILTSWNLTRIVKEAFF